MENIVLVVTVLIVVPVWLYVIARLMSSAVFRSWWEWLKRTKTNNKEE